MFAAGRAASTSSSVALMLDNNPVPRLGIASARLELTPATAARILVRAAGSAVCLSVCLCPSSLSDLRMLLHQLIRVLFFTRPMLQRQLRFARQLLRWTLRLLVWRVHRRPLPELRCDLRMSKHPRLYCPFSTRRIASGERRGEGNGGGGWRQSSGVERKEPRRGG